MSGAFSFNTLVLLHPAKECPRIVAHFSVISSNRPLLTLESIGGHTVSIWFQCASTAGSFNMTVVVCSFIEAVGFTLNVVVQRIHRTAVSMARKRRKVLSSTRKRPPLFTFSTHSFVYSKKTG